MRILREFIDELCQSDGPSGRESGTAQVAAKWLSKLSGQVSMDRLGNVLSSHPISEANAPTILLDAHLDEVGIIITSCENSFAQFTSLGGIDPHILPGQTVKLMTDPPCYAVVACLPPHIQTREDMKTIAPMDKLYLDVAGRDIPVGTTGVFVGEGMNLGEKQYVSKALDDRLGFAMIYRSMQLVPAYEIILGKERHSNVVLSGSVREECGNGVKAVTHAVQPQASFVVDLGFGKQPGTAEENVFPLGSGPILTIAPTCNRKMIRWVQEIAKRENIPLNIEVCGRSTGTNGEDVALTGAGVPTVVFGIPSKYMHTNVETFYWEDAERAAKLLAICVIEYSQEVLK
jgi:endoglucanase